MKSFSSVFKNSIILLITKLIKITITINNKNYIHMKNKNEI